MHQTFFFYSVLFFIYFLTCFCVTINGFHLSFPLFFFLSVRLYVCKPADPVRFVASEGNRTEPNRTEPK